MKTVSIVPESVAPQRTTYRAVAGQYQSNGQTPGEALDTLTSQLDPEEAATLVVIQHMRSDDFFTAEQRQRLEELMARWRSARDSKAALLPAEQAELEALVAAELQAATDRAAALVRGLTS